jgi:carboxylesterase
MSKYMNEYAKPFEFQGTNGAAVLLIHGFTGSPAHMLPIGRYLSSAGYAVKGICLSGHATKPEDMKTATAREWMSEALSAYDEMAKAYDKVAVMGLSMGGCLSLYIAENRKPNAVVTFSAPMQAKNKGARFAPVLKYIMPVIRPSQKKRGSDKLMNEYDIGYTEYPTSSVVELNRVMKAARENLKNVTSPVLSFQSDADMAIAPESISVIQGGVASRVKREIRLSGVPHVITISTQLPRIEEEVIAFLEKNNIR